MAIQATKSEFRRHIVLLGDSIFDNASYTRGGPDVIHQLQQRLSSDEKATLLAVDGAVTSSVIPQCSKLPQDATHLVVSAGGNDALGNINIIEQRAQSVAESLRLLASATARFEDNYKAMLKKVLSYNVKTAVCTIYNPAFPDPTWQQLCTTALALFNDAIIRQAFFHRLPLIDLRLICNEAKDYANPIEPSSAGGLKITAAIERLTREHTYESGNTEVFL